MIGEDLFSKRLDNVGDNEINLSEDYPSKCENKIKEKREQHQKLYHDQAEIMASLQLQSVEGKGSRQR
jgi:hypothetical protein